MINTVATAASGTLDCELGTAQIDLPLDAGDLPHRRQPAAQRPASSPARSAPAGSVGVPEQRHLPGRHQQRHGLHARQHGRERVNGMDVSYPTSHDCPPLLNLSIGTIPIGFALDSGTVSWTGTRRRAHLRTSSGGARRASSAATAATPTRRAFQQPFQQCWENGGRRSRVHRAERHLPAAHQGAFGPNGGAVKTITAVGAAAGSIVDGLPHDQTLVERLLHPADVQRRRSTPPPTSRVLWGSP